ncbi:hypothetical protein OJAV_G00084700 [Oryzias javanicus]|uniref:Uncharacterized protein n=1 Tax=Oryzias javanicus TaxID=123683 RepID=A0A3S2MVE9_ORYJA|nr:hypothetical protein OJAV_G00084700 [Oryzias javanicus]
MYVLCTIVASLVLFLVLKWMKRRRFVTDVKRLDGKTVLITGGNSGVGKETAVALATRGARVIVACRDPEKARRAVTEIRLQSRSLNVCHMELDLANLSSVRGFCRDFLQREKRLDVLINCADAGCVCRTLPKESAPSRVITLTCSNYKYQKLDFQDLNYNLLPFFTYCRSKLANIYFSQELARLTEGKGVSSFAVHPGFVQSGWTAHYSFLFRMLMQVVMWMFFVSSEIGAQTVIYCAVSDEAAKHNGGYFVDCRPAPLRPFARDEGVAKKLWEASERLVKLA